MVELKICPTCGTEYEPRERFCPRDGTALRTQGGSSDLVGQVVADRYHVLRKLGEGGMGQVYLAEHVKMGRKSALKVMHPSMGTDPDAISRFNREAANASRINHPHVAAIYDFGETPEGLIYLAMEFVEGVPLTALVEQQGALPVQRVAVVIEQAAGALAAAHDLGIVHRDLKPDNIMVARNRDGSDCVKVVDFGIAKAGAEGNQKVTRTGLVVGTPEYMSPEQLAGDRLDGRSDVYSLGLVAFNLLTGTLPFPSDSAQESMIMRLTDRPRTLGEMRPEVPWHPALQAVMDRVLARPVAERYQDAPAFARDLAQAIARMPANALHADGTLVMGALPSPTVPPTRVDGGAGATAAVATPATRSTYSPDAAPRAGAAGARVAPGVPARSRTPLVGAVAALAVVAMGAVGWLATRGSPVPADGATVPPAAQQSTGTAPAVDPIAGAPSGGPTSTPGATDGATDGAAGSRPPAQPYANASTGGLPPGGRVAATPAVTSPAATSATATPADEGEADSQLYTGRIALWVQRINASNAGEHLARANAAWFRPRARPRARLFAGVVRAVALQELDRMPEACATLRQVRAEYSVMDADFRETVDANFDPRFDGPCQ